MKTIKQIADEIGVSKQAVHQKRKNKELSIALQPFTSTVDGVVYIDADGENLIKQAFSERNCKSIFDNKPSTVDALIKQLSIKDTQLEEKDKQLSAKDSQIAALTVALENTTASLNAAQALHAADKQQQLLLADNKKRGLFGLFRKKYEK